MRRTLNSMKRSAFYLAPVAFVPSCFAHGEQVLALPMSNAAAFIFFFLFTLFLRERVPIKLLLYALLCLGIALSWRLPLLPGRPAELARYSGSYIFMVGFGLPTATTVLGWAVIRLFRSAQRK